VAKLLLDKGADLEPKDKKYGRTPLLWAAEKRHEAVVKLLLEQDASLESKARLYDQTPCRRQSRTGRGGGEAAA
jgi:ankyrin repeat protein